MEQQKIKKVNVAYLLFHLSIPIIVLTLIAVFAGVVLKADISVVAMIIALGFTASALWWAIGWDSIYKKQREKRMKELDNSGFVRNHTFNADGCTVAVDIVHGQIAIVFRWNPKKCYVLPANRITNVWVDDGKMLGGTSRVSFLFIVDGVKIRVNTFTSNKIWSMKSNYVLEALSKADMMIERLQAAYQTAQNNLYYDNYNG